MIVENNPVALAACPSYDAPNLADLVTRILDVALPQNLNGTRVLVKPNLLVARDLACANATITTEICRYLLAKGAKPVVADSPAFGSAASVARAIGLDKALLPLGLTVHAFKKTARVTLKNPPGKPVVKVARLALESDLLVSTAKIKAHSQTRLTLSVKNCFGCVPGARKAIAHARFGSSLENFCRFLAAIWEILPPTVAVIDGVTAMHVTGPSKGPPFPLGLLGASSYAPALDAAIIRVLGVSPEDIPLQKTLLENEEIRTRLANITYPLLTPENFNAKGFVLPAQLKPASFNPARLLKSLCKRAFLKLMGLRAAN